MPRVRSELPPGTRINLCAAPRSDGFDALKLIAENVRG